MADNIFRKVALERLSSPEQLDQLLETSAPSLWIALSALSILMAALAIWGFEGSIPTEASGQGLLVRSGGVLNIEATASGVVTKVDVTVGDLVKPGQVIASIAQPELVQKIRDTRDLLREAQSREAVALDVHQRAATLQAGALQRQLENAQQRIQVLHEQGKLLEQQVSDQEELARSGIVTKYQVFGARQKLVEVEGQIAAEEASIKQLAAQRFAVESEPAETDQDLKGRVLTLEADLAGMEQQLKLSSHVQSSYDGEVLEVKVSPGSLVTSGTPLLSVEPKSGNLEIVAYVNSREAKNVRADMEAQISPSTVRREEAGFLRGTVAAVADFPATPEAVMRNFENQTLVENLLRSGPVTEVRIDLLRGRTSSGGFLWSSPKSPAVTLSSGTLCTVEVVTKRQKPIDLVLPWARDQSGLN